MNDKYIYSIFSPHKSHTRTPQFVRNLQGLTGFASLYSITKEDVLAIQSAGTTARFAGSVWSERLWIDCDNYDLADKFERKLNELNVAYSAYDTGGRGVHFGVVRSSRPSHLLPLQDKAWVREHFPEADHSIYTHLHLFRLPGTVHETGGREKHLVFEKAGRVLEHPPWEKKEVGFVDKEHFTSPNGSKSVFSCFAIMRNTVPAKIGNRHATLVKLTYSLKDEAQVSPTIALWWLKECNKLFEQPKEEEQLEYIVQSIYGTL